MEEILLLLATNVEDLPDRVKYFLLGVKGPDRPWERLTEQENYHDVLGNNNLENYSN